MLMGAGQDQPDARPDMVICLCGLLLDLTLPIQSLPPRPGDSDSSLTDTGGQRAIAREPAGPAGPAGPDKPPGMRERFYGLGVALAMAGMLAGRIARSRTRRPCRCLTAPRVAGYSRPLARRL